jgi:hypothetical protein
VRGERSPRKRTGWPSVAMAACSSIGSSASSRGGADPRPDRSASGRSAHDPRPARLAGRPGRAPDRNGQSQAPDRVRLQARVTDTAEGFVIVDVAGRGNPPDDRLLERAVARAKQAGMQVRSVYADRGFGTRTRRRRAAQARCRRRRDPAARPGLANPAHAQLEAPLPLPQRTRGPDLSAQTQRSAQDAPTQPRRRADLDWRTRTLPQPPPNGTPDVSGRAWAANRGRETRNPDRPAPRSTEFFRGK